ncbi:MAG: DUF86 domain-containing protein [Lachnospiraceae bacterium]|nr:DUF86 domain-containing protein [Lachnospiraceae bacterium]
MDNIKNDAYYVQNMLFRMIQISENAKKLSDDYRATHSYIPWNALGGLRNRIVHDYGNVDLNIVYETLKRDMPEVLELLEDEKD